MYKNRGKRYSYCTLRKKILGDTLKSLKRQQKTEFYRYFEERLISQASIRNSTAKLNALENTIQTTFARLDSIQVSVFKLRENVLFSLVHRQLGAESMYELTQ